MSRLKFKYVRIQSRDLAPNTLIGRGVFSTCMQLVRDKVMEQEDEDLYLEIDSWFSENLPWPPPCQRQEPVVCWFKVENSDEMIKMIRPALWLLDRYETPYYLVYTNSPGEIVYEDKYQVVTRMGVRINEMQEPWGPELVEEEPGSHVEPESQEEE